MVLPRIAEAVNRAVHLVKIHGCVAFLLLMFLLRRQDSRRILRAAPSFAFVVVVFREARTTDVVVICEAPPTPGD